MRARLSRAYRVGNRILLRRTDGYEVVVDGFRPYFWVPADRDDAEAIDYLGRTVKRLVLDDPGEVPRIRDQYPFTDESDVPFVLRFLIDHGIWSGFGDHLEPVKPDPGDLWDPLYLDIEVDTERFPPDPRRDPVVMVQARWRGKTMIWDAETYTEQQLLRITGVLFEKTDLVYGWNIGWDIGYLRQRARVHGVRLPPVEDVDMMELYRWITFQAEGEKRSYALKDIVREELGVEYTDLGPHIHEYVADGRWDELRRYGAMDVEVLEQLDQELDMTRILATIQDLTGALPGRWHASEVIDTYLLRISSAPLPRRPVNAERAVYEGAYVHTPPAGLYEGVAVYDFKSLYPSIIVNEGIGGVLVDVVRHFMRLRERFRAERLRLDPDDPEYRTVYIKERVAKMLANACYGVFAYPRFRLYDPRVSAAVAGKGRELVKTLIGLVETWGHRVLYADTDSAFVQVPFDQAREVEERVNRALAPYRVKWEKYYSRILFKSAHGLTGVRKKYAGRLVWKDGHRVNRVDITGFEAVRSDTPEYTRRVMRMIIEALLDGDVERAEEIYLRGLHEIREQPLHMVAIPKGLRKIDAESPWKRGMEKARRYGYYFPPGVKPLLLWTNQGPFAIPGPVDGLPDGIRVLWSVQTEKAYASKLRDLVRSARMTRQSRIDGWLG